MPEAGSRSAPTDAPTREIDTGCGELLCSIEAGVATVTLHRPEARNALTMEMKQALWQLQREMEDILDKRSQRGPISPYRRPGRRSGSKKPSKSGCFFSHFRDFW